MVQSQTSLVSFISRSLVSRLYIGTVNDSLPHVRPRRSYNIVPPFTATCLSLSLLLLLATCQLQSTSINILRRQGLQDEAFQSYREHCQNLI